VARARRFAPSFAPSFALAAFALAAFALAACGGDHPVAPVSGSLPPGVVARVPPLTVSAEQVARIAARRGLDPRAARDAAVSDAVLARGALDRGLDASPETQGRVSAELARRTLRRLLDEARATPPTEDEMRAAAERKWLDVDRPEGSRTVHAVVVIEQEKANPAELARARAVAEAIHAAALPIAARAEAMPLVEGAPHPSDRLPPSEDPDPLSRAFRLAAAAVPTDGFQVVVQPLDTVSAEGRILKPTGGAYLAPFAAAAAALPARGALSPVSPSPAGLHVILLLERTPAQILTGEARALRLRDDVVNERARAASQRLLASLRPRAEIAAEAPGLLGLVNVEP
jgi:peptidyl-prolyl cis-trans isomerase C